MDALNLILKVGALLCLAASFLAERRGWGSHSEVLLPPFNLRVGPGAGWALVAVVFAVAALGVNGLS